MSETTPSVVVPPEIKPVSPVTPPAAVKAAETLDSKPANPKLLSTLLGLTKPEEVVVAPVKKEPEAVAPVEPVAKKLPPVARREKPALAAPAGPTTEEVRRIAAEESKRATEAAAKPPIFATPAVPPVDNDLTPEEQEELDLAAYAGTKDPSRKGLADQFRNFYKSQKTFLERKVSEDPDYNPEQDPEFKRFLDKNQPKFSPIERKKIFAEKIKSETLAESEARATKAAEAKFSPVISEVQRELTELKHKPRIVERMNRYAAEVVEGMPSDIVQAFRANGHDIAKTREQFPGEFDDVLSTVRGANTLAEEAMALKSGVKTFNAADPKHAYLNDFVNRQGDFLASRPASDQVREGKTFVHPLKWNASMEGKHWTFSEEDLLHMLKLEAQREAKTKVDSFRSRVKQSTEAQLKRSAAPGGAITPAAPVVESPEPSTRTPPSPHSGAAVPATKPKSVLSSLLRL